MTSYAPLPAASRSVPGPGRPDQRTERMAHWRLLRLGFVPLLLALWCWPPSTGSLQVEMAGETQTVLLNDNATIVCKVQGPRHLDITIMGVTWFWKHQMSATEVILFQFFGAHRKIVRPGASVPLSRLERGDASLQLPGVQLWEAGEYRCEVVITPHKAVGRVRLEVMAYPVSSLFPEQAMVKENEEQLISCMASGFYPTNISITWKKWTQKDPRYAEVSEDVFTNSITENEDGMFNVTSFLRLKPSLEDNMTIYQCVVWHKSLPTCQRLNFTLTVIEPEKTTYTWVYVFVSAGILIFVLILCISWKQVPCRTNPLFPVLKAYSQDTQIDTSTEEL
ncbi:natural cytotoxicity triggering receptor 3 ligand 1 [Ursus maritimus]|uniref:Natural cytotoxicity triggering receptor 3 ligand 1 n=2 Tax=Ursus maritimus TaxID=29073 RepID=A0A8M1GJ60_URSMA|nr:natural cytotoxicity triggering receptor 3 ligand 1 [Ursus maritimus]XP_044235750.3 natural cytotoxicity triggering receptor 3 ligand 1 [Ursus arctos]